MLHQCRFLIIFGLCLACLSTARAQVVPPELSADQPIEFDAENNRMTARGNAVLDHGKIRVESDTIIFDQNASTIKARDGVTLTRGGFRVLADESDYNYFNRTFYTDDFRMGRHPVYLKGTQSKGDNNLIEVDDGRLWFTEPDSFALNLEADKMSLEDEETLVMEDVWFQIGDVPFFYFPYYEYNINDDQPFEYKGEIGQRGQLGFFWRNQVMIRAMQELRFGANIDGYTERGVLGGPVLEYNWSDELIDGEMYGLINTGFIYDEGSTSQLGTDVLGRPIQRNRYFMEWRHKQFAFDNAFDLTNSISWWSDSEVERDFRPGLFEDNQQPDNFFDATYRGENWFVNAIARIEPNDFQVVAQRLPEVRFDLVPSQIFETGVFQRADVSYATLAENSPTGAFSQLDSNRFNAYYGMEYPIAANDWLTLKPVAGVMTTFYGTTLGTQGNYTRILGEVGIDIDATAVGTWQYENEFWGIDGLRHFLQPTVQYRYIPGAQAGSTVIPPIDRRASFETYLEPIGLADKRNIDDLYEENAIRVGVQNLFQTRHPEYGSRDLVELDLFQEFRFATRPAQPARFGQPAEPAQQDFSDTFIDLRINPAYWVQFSTFLRINPNDLNLDQITTGIRLIDGEKWTVFFGNNYVTDISGLSINQFVVDTRYRLDSRNLIGAYWWIDADLGELVEQVYLWETMLGNSWELAFAIINRSGASREASIQFQVSVSLVRI